MKARVPYTHLQSTHGANMRSVAAVILLTAKLLYDNGVSAKTLQIWVQHLNIVYKEVMQGNNTWVDEVQYWAEHYHLHVPANATLRILGAEPMSGAALQLLVQIELWTLGQHGYGGIRLRRYLARMPFDRTQLYTIEHLTSWAASKGIHFKY